MRTKPNWDALVKNIHSQPLMHPSNMSASPQDQFGNSEVGHLNIGAGRIVRQDISRIDYDIETGDFFRQLNLLAAVNLAKAGGKRLHLLGLLSDGGVHSHEQHLPALLRLVHENGLQDVIVHKASSTAAIRRRKAQKPICSASASS